MNLSEEIKYEIAKTLYEDSHYNYTHPPSWGNAKGIIKGRYLDRADKVFAAIDGYMRKNSLCPMCMKQFKEIG